MNRYRLVFGLAIALLIGACEDFEDENIDFSNSLSQYVELSSASAITAEAGTNVDITVRMRETINVPITIDYEITGDIQGSGSVMIEKSQLSTAITVQLPMNPTSGNAEVKLTGVDNNLSLGRGGPDAGLSPLARSVSW